MMMRRMTTGMLGAGAGGSSRPTNFLKRYRRSDENMTYHDLSQQMPSPNKGMIEFKA